MSSPPAGLFVGSFSFGDVIFSEFCFDLTFSALGLLFIATHIEPGALFVVDLSESDCWGDSVLDFLIEVRLGTPDISFFVDDDDVD